jgi:hypothetical protein
LLKSSDGFLSATYIILSTIDIFILLQKCFHFLIIEDYHFFMDD